MANSRYELYNEHLATYSGEGDTKVNDCPRYVTFTFPGIPFWSFDYQSRAPGLIGVVGTVQDCWMYGMSRRKPEPSNKTVVLTSEMITSGLMTFHTDIEMTIARSLYNHSAPIWPLKAKFFYGYQRGVFVTHCLELEMPNLPHPLITHKMCLGFVDAQTRRVVDTLPQWYMDELNGKQVLQEGLRLDRLNPRPETAYRQSAKTLIFDMDQFKHTNYKTYIGYCIKALQTAITIKEVANKPNKEDRPGKVNNSNKSSEREIKRLKDSNGNHKHFLPRWMSSEIMKQGVKTMRSKFIKESRAGEDVEIYLWQEEGKPFWVFFTVERKKPGKTGSAILFELALEYFEPQPNL